MSKPLPDVRFEVNTVRASELVAALQRQIEELGTRGYWIEVVLVSLALALAIGGAVAVVYGFAMFLAWIGPGWTIALGIGGMFFALVFGLVAERRRLESPE